ncbi:protein takeout-like [Atheta coriaria]|uniref:protein takeout-like n=1 Tax=Dalotia coriaria TaxID=877792 RepID=UPI0031F44719
MRLSATVVSCVISFCCLVGYTFAKKKIIDEVKICKRNDPNLSDCYADNFRRLVPLTKNGIPEMNLLKVEPLLVDKVLLDFTQSRTFRLETVLEKINMSGLGATNLTGCVIKIIPDGMTADLEMNIPEVTMKSTYKAKGNFLLININSKGDFVGNFTGLKVRGQWKSQRFMKKNKEYLGFKDTSLDIEIKVIRVHFENLFGNNTELNDSINNAINDNIDVLYDELKPIVLQTIRAIILEAVNNVFGLFPYNVLFPEK